MGTTTLEVEPLDATFGATVTGVRLATLDDETWAALTRPGWSTGC